MANEPKLRKKNIEDLEDRVTILEGGTPEPHSNTMTKPELEDLGDRITVLEGGTPGAHSNPMRFEFFTSVEDRVEELEDGDYFSVIFETHLAKEGPGKLILKDNVTFPEKYWDTNNTEHVLKDIDSMTLKLDGHKLTYLRYVDNDGFWFSLPQDELAEIVSKYGTSFEGCPVEVIASAGILELNGAKSKAINMSEVYGVEHKPLWLVVPAEPTNYTLTYDYNGAKDPEGASVSEGDSYPEGTDVELTLAPTHSGWVIPDGKVFAGWTTVRGADYTKVTHIVLDSNTTVYAYWVDGEHNLVPITVEDELEGFWIKPKVELDPTDPVVSNAYTQAGDAGPMRAEFALSSCSSNNGEVVARIIFASDSDSYTHHTTFNNGKIDILYTRVETDASISGNDVYSLNGIAEIDGTSVNLSTITRPIYISISDFFTDTITLQGTGSVDSCDALSCNFFFKEDGSR